MSGSGELGNVEDCDIRIETNFLFAKINDIQNQACSQQSQPKDASISMSGFEEIGRVGDCDADIEIDSLFDEIGDIAGPQNDSLLSGVNGIFADVESKANDIESEMRDIENSCDSLKRKTRTGSQRNPLVIPDSSTESESDSESEDELVQNAGRFLNGRQVHSWSRRIDETDDEADDIEFEIDGTRVHADSTRSSNDGIADEIGGSEDNGQSHHRPATLAGGHSDSTDITPPKRRKNAVRSDDDNGDGDLRNLASTVDSEWRIHGIIGKEVIKGEIHYCVDWYPPFVPECEPGKARRLVREFEAKEQAKHRKLGHIRKKKRQGRPRKQK